MRLHSYEGTRQAVEEKSKRSEYRVGVTRYMASSLGRRQSNMVVKAVIISTWLLSFLSIISTVLHSLVASLHVCVKNVGGMYVLQYITVTFVPCKANSELVTWPWWRTPQKRPIKTLDPIQSLRAHGDTVMRDAKMQSGNKHGKIYLGSWCGEQESKIIPEIIINRHSVVRFCANVVLSP